MKYMIVYAINEAGLTSSEPYLDDIPLFGLHNVVIWLSTAVNGSYEMSSGLHGCRDQVVVIQNS